MAQYAEKNGASIFLGSPEEIHAHLKSLGWSDEAAEAFMRGSTISRTGDREIIPGSGLFEPSEETIWTHGEDGKWSGRSPTKAEE